MTETETGAGSDRPKVLIPRSPDRAGRWAEACAAAGLEPVLVPLIDFERAEHPELLAALPADLQEASSRGSALLAVTSITTLRALAEAGVLDELRRICTEGKITVAAVGRASGDALRAEGISPGIEPEAAMNAEGLLALLEGEQPGTAFLPQADIAAPTLAEGLERLGWTVVVIQAYRTVEAPADPARRITAALRGGREGSRPAPAARRVRVLTPQEAAAEPWDALLGMSPSSARRIVEVLGGSGRERPLPPFVAIGPSTAAQARSLGVSVAETAARPTPDDTVAALLRAVAPRTGGTPPKARQTSTAEEPLQESR